MVLGMEEKIFVREESKDEVPLVPL